MTKSVEDRLLQHGHVLPTAPEAVGFYLPVLQSGNLVVTSGQLPMVGKELMFKGKVGSELHEEQAFHAACLELPRTNQGLFGKSGTSGSDCSG